MFNNLFGQLGELQKQMEETKANLNNITVTSESGDGKVKVSANGNRRITEIKIDSQWGKEADAEELEDLIMVALNRALEKAEQASDREMKNAAKGYLPGGLEDMM